MCDVINFVFDFRFSFFDLFSKVSHYAFFQSIVFVLVVDFCVVYCLCICSHGFLVFSNLAFYCQLIVSVSFTCGFVLRDNRSFNTRFLKRGRLIGP
jgi:hypothetical protein